jgi:hypothetical protein
VLAFCANAYSLGDSRGSSGAQSTTTWRCLSSRTPAIVSVRSELAADLAADLAAVVLAGVLLVELDLGDRRADVGRAAARDRAAVCHHLAAAVVLARVLWVEFELAAIEDSPASTRGAARPSARRSPSSIRSRARAR